MVQLMRALALEGRTPTFRATCGTLYPLPLDARAYTFQDHGAAGHRDCVACRVDRTRRFALFVDTPRGSLGPLGSTCLFERVLGLRSQEAQRLARLLEQVAREASHRERHQPLLREHPSHVLYLRALGFEWTRDAELLARASLTGAQRQALRTWNKGPLSPLPLALFEVLAALTSAVPDPAPPPAVASATVSSSASVSIAQLNRAARIRRTLERESEQKQARSRRTRTQDGSARSLTSGEHEILRFVLAHPLPPGDREKFEALLIAGRAANGQWKQVTAAQRALLEPPGGSTPGVHWLNEVHELLPRQFHARFRQLRDLGAPGINPELKEAMLLTEAIRAGTLPPPSDEDLEVRAHQLASLELGLCAPVALFGPWRRHLKAHLQRAPLAQGVADLTGLSFYDAERVPPARRRTELLQATIRHLLKLRGEREVLAWYRRDPAGALSRSVFVAEHHAQTGELHERTLPWLRALAERERS